MLGSVPSRSASSSRDRVAARAASAGSAGTTTSASSRRGTRAGSSAAAGSGCRRARRPCARRNSSLASSSQCRSSISVTVGCSSRDALDHLPHHAEQLALARLRVELRRRALRDRRRRGSRRAAAARRAKSSSSSTMRPAIFSRALRSSSLARDPEVGAEHLEDRQERDVLAVRDGARLRRRACRARGSARGTRSRAGSCRCPPRRPRRPPAPLPACASARARLRACAGRPRGRRSARGRARARRRSGCARRRGR